MILTGHFHTTRIFVEFFLEPCPPLVSYRQFGSVYGYEAVYGASADADGSFFLAGVTSDSVDGETVNAGGDDFFVAKMSGTDGSIEWFWQVQ